MKLFLVPFKKGSAPLEVAEVDDMLAGRGDVQISLASDECVEVDGDVLEYLSGLGDEYRKAYSEGVGIWTRVSPRDKWRPGTVQENIEKEMVLRGYMGRWYAWSREDGDTVEEIVGAIASRNRENICGGPYSEFLHARVDVLEPLVQESLGPDMFVRLSSCLLEKVNVASRVLRVSFHVSAIRDRCVEWGSFVVAEEGWTEDLSSRERLRWFGNHQEFGTSREAWEYLLREDIRRIQKQVEERARTLEILQGVRGRVS